MSEDAVLRVTPRQQQVLTALWCGKSSKEIAAALGVGVKVVEYHRARLRRRFQAHSTIELIRKAIESGALTIG